MGDRWGLISVSNILCSNYMYAGLAVEYLRESRHEDIQSRYKLYS